MWGRLTEVLRGAGWTQQARPGRADGDTSTGVQQSLRLQPIVPIDLNAVASASASANASQLLARVVFSFLASKLVLAQRVVTAAASSLLIYPPGGISSENLG